MSYISKIKKQDVEYDIKDTEAREELKNKQPTLVSGENIKTINNQSILGSGNINISGGGSGEGGTTNYEELNNKPKINNVELLGEKTLDELGIQPKGDYANSNDLNNRFVNIEEKIPTQATSGNQLADKSFVNSSISTNTATFKGTYLSLDELNDIQADSNDYAFYSHLDQNGNTVFDRYKYTERGEARIPEEYQEIKYVTSDGTQFIDLKHKPTSSTKWVIDCKFNNTAGTQFNGLITPKFDIAIYNNKFTFSAGGALTVVMPADTLRHKLTLDAPNGKAKVDDATFDIPLSSISASNSLFLFARNQNNSAIQNSSMRVYSSQIYENNILQMDLVPCYRKSDNKVGFYDLVHNEFLTSEVDLITSDVATSEWLYEYSLNNSSFTAEQWVTLNSELTKYVTANGFDKTKTQVLKNINGTLTWVDE